MNGYGGEVGYRTNRSVVREDRSLLWYVILSIITCGIYGVWFIHCMAKDMNEMCEGDGKNTAGVAKLFILEFLTLGIYQYIWYYQIGERIYNNADRYGVTINESGKTIIVWMLLGFVTFGIGHLIGCYKLFRNMNELAMAYNRS